MKKQFFTALFILLSALSYGQQQSRLKLSPALPVAGREITLNYQAAGSDLEFSDAVKAALLIYRDFEWQIDSITLQQVKGGWSGKYTLPGSSAFMAVKLFQGNLGQPEAQDNQEGQGFYTQVVSAKGKKVPGSALAEAAILTPEYGGNRLRLFTQPANNAIKVVELLKKEQQIQGSNLRNYLAIYLDLEKRNLPDAEFKVLASSTLNKVLQNKDLTEDELAAINRAYEVYLQDKDNAAKVAARLKATYPNGGQARFMAFQQASAVQNPAAHQKAALQFLKDFPISEWRKKPDGRGFMYYAIYRGIGAYYFDAKDYENFGAMFSDLDFKTANEVYRWNVMKAAMMKLAAPEILFKLSQKIIPQLLERQQDGSYHEDFNIKEEAQKNADEQMDNRLFTHIFLADVVGADQEGKDYFPKLSAKGLYGNAELNEIHLHILEKLNDEKNIVPLLEMSVKSNAVTPVMFAKLKAEYSKGNNSSEKGYDKYLASLKSPEEMATLLKHVQENMVNHPLIPFTLEDADGNMVSSSSWKDKIVVIDFWATWCRPCIMAFPGMQLLVDKYAKDPSVGIYMIGTMQNGDYKTKSVNYVRESGFRFNLLHDAVSENGEQNKVFRSLVPLFNSSGIPRKIIVKNGVVRYSSEGYSGSPSLLMDELSMAIELLRAEK